MQRSGILVGRFESPQGIGRSVFFSHERLLPGRSMGPRARMVVSHVPPSFSQRIYLWMCRKNFKHTRTHTHTHNRWKLAKTYFRTAKCFSKREPTCQSSGHYGWVKSVERRLGRKWLTQTILALVSSGDDNTKITMIKASVTFFRGYASEVPSHLIAVS